MAGAFHVKDDFKAGGPISQVPASWFNKVASLLNNLLGIKGISLVKNERGVATVGIDEEKIMEVKPLADLKSDVEDLQNDVGDLQNAVPSADATSTTNKRDTNTDDDTGATGWTWNRHGSKGLSFDAYTLVEADGNYHWFSRVRLTFSKDGLLVKAQGLTGRRLVFA